MSYLFDTFFYNPIFNLLVYLYDTIPGTDLAIAIIILTVALRLIMWPLSRKSFVAQRELSELQPKQTALREKYKDNKEKLMQETMALYKEHKINPLSSCLPILIQLPFLLALYWALRNINDPASLSVLYDFVPNPGSIEPIGLFGLLDLSMPNIVLALMAGAAQFWQGSMLQKRRPPLKTEGAKDEDFSAIMNKQIMYVMPVVTVFIAMSFPSGLALYWFMSTFLMALQQWYHFHFKSSDTNSSKVTAVEVK
jgi:YidC/Oxa1 family membrane protein insertase